MRKRIVSIFISISIMIILMIFLKIIKNNIFLVEENNNRLKANQEISQISKNMQTMLNLSMQYSEFLELIIENNPNITEEALESYASYIIKNNSIIDNISIAPHCIIKYIYPLEGNEDVIGHDLLNDPDRKDAVEEAIETNSSVVQGPVKARQGVVKIFNRKAVFINENEERKLWGIVSVAINFDQLIDIFNLNNQTSNYLYAIRVHNPNSSEDFLWGNKEIFDKDSIIKYINLPHEKWQIAIYPKGGWANDKSTYRNINYLIDLILIIVLFLSYFSINHYQEIREAARLDPLTGAYNKRYFERYVKGKIIGSNKKHGLILIDIDKFKSINDTLGHIAGDNVLKEVTNRMKTIIGDKDKIGRIGGDEFVIFVNDIKNKDDLFNMMDSIKNKIKLPMEFGKNKLEVTCSLGLAIYKEDGKSYIDLYEVADKKMYENKV